MQLTTRAWSRQSVQLYRWRDCVHASISSKPIVNEGIFHGYNDEVMHIVSCTVWVSVLREMEVPNRWQLVCNAPIHSDVLWNQTNTIENLTVYHRFSFLSIDSCCWCSAKLGRVVFGGIECYMSIEVVSHRSDKIEIQLKLINNRGHKMSESILMNL